MGILQQMGQMVELRHLKQREAIKTASSVLAAKKPQHELYTVDYAHVMEIQRQQAEQIIAEQIRAIYQSKLGHCPGFVTCQLFDDKIVIIMEHTITPPEKLLLQIDQKQLVKRVRLSIDRAMQPYLKALIEQVISVPVLDLLIDTTVHTERTGGIAILADKPTLYG